MRLVRVLPLITACAFVLIAVTLSADSALAQTAPGQAVVVVNANNSVTVSFPAATPTPSGGYGIAASVNGVQLFTTTSPFLIGNLLSFQSTPIGPGTYTIQIVAIHGTTLLAGPSTTFVIGGSSQLPFTNVLNEEVVNGTTVTLSWSAIANATSYEVEAVVQSTGQTFLLPVGNVTLLVVPNVPFANYIVRVRGRNAAGAGAFSNPIQVIVGVVLGTGDLQATLTWNTTADIDLHVIEPNGTHVYFAFRNGTTATLDFDDRDFGPENIFVGASGAAAGTYQIFIVHFAGPAPTTSTVAVTLRAGTPSAQSFLFTRVTSAANIGVGYNVANVNVLTGQIIEATGTRAAYERGTPPAKNQ
jgi:hypothetical protein